MASNCLDMADDQLVDLYDYIQTQLGGATIDVEIDKDEVQELACQAWKDYMKYINMWQTRNEFANIYGTNASKNITKYFIYENQQLAQQISDWIASMAISGGNIPWRKDFIVLEDRRQIYDLAKESSHPYERGQRKINRVMWYAPPELVHHTLQGTDPYYNNLFNFGQQGLMINNSPLYYLGNIFDVVMIKQSLEERNKVLFGEFYYNLSGDILELMPMPGTRPNIREGSRIFYYYIDKDDYINIPDRDQTDLIANPAEVQIDYMKYSSLNTIARDWIKEKTYARAKRMLGEKWRKIQRVYTGEEGYEIELDYDSMLSEADELSESLNTQLQEYLETMNIKQMMEDKVEISNNAAEINNKQPRWGFFG